MNKINIGCGMNVREGWINLDQHDKNGANSIFNLEKLFNGDKLPFPDNHFDYVYCSHVIEDFIEPIVIIEELFRICKVGGRIEIKTPFETNTNMTNILHKSQFTLSKFRTLGGRDYYSHYGKKSNVEIEELNYYIELNTTKSEFSLFNITKRIIGFVYNLFPIKIIEYTFLKYIFCILNCRVIYKKVNNAKDVQDE